MSTLQEILDTMDVPHLRHNDMGWLLRNLGIRNGDHPEFDRAMNLARAEWVRERR